MKNNDNNTESLTTTHESCNILVDLLVAYGVKYAIVSPGSRNAPVIIALTRCESIIKYVIVDERSAAFAAIGIAQQQRCPVAIICTSGSAVLNYAPTVSEAYYQKIPLIVISADRPLEWIGQNDSQTIKQYGILDHIVKRSFDIPAKCESENELWYCNRTINEALQTAIMQPHGPVHINIQLGEPLYDRKETKLVESRVISHFKAEVPAELMRESVQKIASYRKVLILASMNPYCQELSNSLDCIGSRNAVVLSEVISNNHGKYIFNSIDRILTGISEEKWCELKPELLITFGGAPVSRLVKSMLRRFKGIEHWRIGYDNGLIDTMQNLTQTIEISPAKFFSIIAKDVRFDKEYYQLWNDACVQAGNTHSMFIENAPWSDLKAMDIIMNSLPERRLNLQVSNGSSIRYADIIGTPIGFSGTCHCNRGVSGIDGSTSTALGASMVNDKDTTLLITGDMSFSYDLGGLATQYNNNQFKIIVLCNGGGGIFRFINGPSNLPEFERYFEVHRSIPIDKYADAFGFEYFKADNAEALQQELERFYQCKSPAILAVYTDNKVSAETLKQYYNRNKR